MFTISGIMAGVGGIVLAARLQSVNLNVGGGTLLLDSISAAVIGGVSLCERELGRRTDVRAYVAIDLLDAVENGLREFARRDVASGELLACFVDRQPVQVRHYSSTARTRR